MGKCQRIHGEQWGSSAGRTFQERGVSHTGLCLPRRQVPSLEAPGLNSNLIPLRRVDSRPQDYARHADGKGLKDTDRWLRSQNRRADK